MKIELSERDFEILVAAVRSIMLDAEDADYDDEDDSDEGVVYPPWEWAEYDRESGKMRYGEHRENTMAVEDFLHQALNRAAEVL